MHRSTENPTDDLASAIPQPHVLKAPLAEVAPHLGGPQSAPVVYAWTGTPPVGGVAGDRKDTMAEHATPLKAAKARVPLPRQFLAQRYASGVSPSRPSTILTQPATPTPSAKSYAQRKAASDAWIWEKTSGGQSIVDTLNSTYQQNSNHPSPAVRRSSSANTEPKPPPAKRRRLSRTPLSSVTPTSSTSYTLVPSSLSTDTGRTSISPVQHISNGDSKQEPVPKRKIPPLPRLPRKSASTISSHTAVLPSSSSVPMEPASTTSKPAPLPAVTPTPPVPSPVVVSQTVHIKTEPVNDTLSPTSPARPQSTSNTTPQAPVKTEPFAPSLPASPQLPSHTPEHASSGTERVHPVPDSCRPGVQGWVENRQLWMRAAVRDVKRRGLKVTRVKLLSDGLVIDWERSSTSASTSRSASATARDGTRAVVLPATPPMPPPLSPALSHASRPSSTCSTSANPPPPVALAAASPATSSAALPPAPPLLQNPTPVSSPSVPSPEQASPAAVPAPQPVNMTMFAKLLVKKKQIQTEKQAGARRKLEEEAVRRQEEAKKARGSPSPLPATPPPPADLPPRFRLDTPPPPWGTDGQARTAENERPSAAGAPSAHSRHSSVDIVQEMVQTRDESSDDEDMYLDPNDIPDRPPPQDEPVVYDVAKDDPQGSNATDMARAIAASDVPIQLEDHSPLSRIPSVPLNLDSSLPATSSSAPIASSSPEEPVPPPKNVEADPRSTPPTLPVAIAASAIPATSTNTQPPASLVLSATQEGLPVPIETEREKLEEDALEWLKQYIIAFDTDRAALASAYSQHATFSIRRFSHPSAQHTDAPATSTPRVVVGTLAILTALLALPESFTFNVGDAARPPTVEYDLVVAFDMVVYGTDADAGGPGVMVVCYVDPTGPARGGRARWVCEMQVVLRRRGWSECDGGAGDGMKLVALSHQMTLRRVPAAMDWNWR